MSEITKAIQFICDEKGLTYESVMEAVEAAMAAAYRKDFGNRQQNVKVKFDPETMGMEVWDEKEVVEDIDEETLLKAQEELTKRREEAQKDGRELTEEEMADLARFNPKTQIMITQAKEHSKKAKVGEIIKIKLEVPGDFGRMAAQTAKQVVIQRLREAERNSVFDELKEQVGTIIHGIVQRRDRTGAMIIDLGKTTALLPAEEQIYGEQYRPGARMRFLIGKVEMGQRGLEIILSRAGKKMVETIFAEEIPEVGSGAVEVKGLARDAGHRSKVAVWTGDDSIDPIGACIGQRGSRITTIIEGLGGEKIDVIQYSDDAAEYIKHALSPAKVTAVSLNEGNKEATVYVAGDQFSLAIGRGGQNVRLAAELTGWKLNVVQNENEEKIVSSDADPKEVEKIVEESSSATVDEATEDKREKVLEEKSSSALLDGATADKEEKVEEKKEEAVTAED